MPSLPVLTARGVCLQPSVRAIESSDRVHGGIVHGLGIVMANDLDARVSDEAGAKSPTTYGLAREVPASRLLAQFNRHTNHHSGVTAGW